MVPTGSAVSPARCAGCEPTVPAPWTEVPVPIDGGPDDDPGKTGDDGERQTGAADHEGADLPGIGSSGGRRARLDEWRG